MREYLGLVGLGAGFGAIAGELTRHNYVMQSVIIGVAGVILLAAVVWRRVNPRV